MKEKTKQKITPFLWFDHQAEEAMNYYVGLFADSQILEVRRYPEEAMGPMEGMGGKVLTGVFELAGQRFMALDGGPVFHFTPAVSFFVNCETEAEIDALWSVLLAGGAELMPLQAYPFSARFGWLQDKYGLSWQLNLGQSEQKITPFFMFVGEQHGQAEAAMALYTSLFDDGRIVHLGRSGEDEGGADSVSQAVFTLHGQTFMAFDGGVNHDFSFTEAISFFVDCQTQEEVDELWQTLTEGGDESAQQCGWLKDRFGVSWQIVPEALSVLMNDPDAEKSQRVIQAMLQMKKIDTAVLQQAYDGV